jgi:integrase/recombinase XerD
MLERCFVRAKTLIGIHSSWVGPAIEQYAAWLGEHGYRVGTLAARVSLLRQFGTFAHTHGAQRYEELPAYEGSFLEFWFHRCRPRRASMPPVTRHVRIAIEQMLRVVVPGFVGRPRRHAIRDPFADQAPGFSAYLRHERGLRETTLRMYDEHLRVFAAYLNDIGQRDLRGLSPAVVSGFLTDRSQGLHGRCGVLRVFLRYVHREQLVARDLSLVAQAAPCYRLAHVPRSITAEDVRRMLDAVDRDTVLGRRDYAMLRLLVTYGLRAREVAALTLDDIDWRHDRLRVPARKAGHSTAYPLSPGVGAALLEYLRAGGRPVTRLRQVFFHVTAPCMPITQGAVSSRAARYLHQTGVVGPRLGSHTLRHSCVQRLVEAGWSLKAIGDYVGHASPASTEIYSKVAVETLRDVALGAGEEVL